MIGIYKIENLINGNKYIGQSNNITKRWNAEKRTAFNEKDPRYEYPLSRALRKYGIENFEIVILKKDLKTQCLMNFWECYYIDKYNTLANNKNGYNIFTRG